MMKGKNMKIYSVIFLGLLFNPLISLAENSTSTTNPVLKEGVSVLPYELMSTS